MPKYPPTDDPVEVLERVDKALDDLYDEISNEIHDDDPDLECIRSSASRVVDALESYVPSEKPPKEKTGKDLAAYNDYVRRANARIRAARAARKKDELAGIYVKDWNA